MNPSILRIAVPSPLTEGLDYLIPTGLDPASLRPGIRVRVPLGGSRKVGVLVELRTSSPLTPERLRLALEVLDSEPLIAPDLLELAAWAVRYYHHPPGEVYATLLPAPLRKGQPARFESVTLWRLTDAGREALAGDAVSRAPRRRQILNFLSRHPQGVAAPLLRRELTPSSDLLRAIRERGWVELSDTEFVPALEPSPRRDEPPVLNPDQRRAVNAVRAALDGFGVFLLNGVTGSGKTEVYLRIMEQVLAQGRQVLVLVPEIGLTPQLLERVRRRLPYPLVVMHSALNDRERLDAWLMARNGQAAVVIGTRSAVFAPLPNPGLFIVDEEHDPSLKQQEGFRYHARDLLVMRARQRGIPVLMGSATPSLESLYNVRRGRYEELPLPARVGRAVEPPIELLDVRRQEMEEGLSRPLLARIRAHLQRGEQVLLFLNRRGFAPTLICHECGWLGQCRNCDAHLTLHLRHHRLICHHCGYRQPLLDRCPDCGSIDLRALGAGTERVEQMLKREFSDQGIARIDRDSTRRRGSLDKLLADIHAGRRRLLLGTQMLAKGHHFPEVTLVGIVNADQGLFGSDFRAGERMAQQIIQVAGRAGRADKPGLVTVQTHHPDHPLLLSLVRQGYAAFAAATLEERYVTGLPPYSHQALLRADAKDQDSPMAFLNKATALGLDRAPPGLELLGPVPAPMERRAGRYRAQLLIQAPERKSLHEFLGGWVERLGTLKAARKVRWSLDVDPVELL